MQVRRLSWAGVEIATDRCTILIDPFETTGPVAPVMGRPHWQPVPVPSFATDREVHALITHNHPDHYDRDALRRALGPDGRVYCPIEIVPELEQDGFDARGLDVWNSALVDERVSIAAVPSVDWIGDAQVAWVVDDGVHRIFHGGDTIWHGSWWSIAKKFGPFDIAFLPVNGVVATIPGIEPSNLPGTLTPEQAVVAARLLKAKALCPIHYGQFSDDDSYREYPSVVDALRFAAERDEVSLHLVQDGEQVLR